MKLASRISRLGTETAFEVLARAKGLEAQGKRVIHLEIGEPDFDTPQNIRDAAVKALNEGYTHYVPAAGIPEVREAIAAEINATRGLNTGVNNVVIVPGGKPIMFYVALALLDHGDEAIYPNPGFPIYESVINFAGAKPVPMPLLEEFDFGVDVDKLEDLITDKTRLIILNSPQNPTGGVLTKEQLKRIAEIATKKDIWILSDEIYSRSVYDGKHESITQFGDMFERTVLLDGMSKTYAMTGWRLGYGVMPAPLAEQIALLMINSNSCTSAFSQMAMKEAITGDQSGAEAMVVEFKKRRDLIVDGLNKIPGISCKTPAGAFYVFPNVKETGWDSKKLADALLDEAGVATLSGTAFGEYGDGYLRLSYANSQENIKEALEKIAGFLKK